MRNSVRCLISTLARSPRAVDLCGQWVLTACSVRNCSSHRSNDGTNPKVAMDAEQLRRDMVKFLHRVRDPSKLDTKYIPKPAKKGTGAGYTKLPFKDYLKLRVKAGNGGDGCISMHHESLQEFGGPDGGDGGNGGHVIFKAVSDVNSLGNIAVSLTAQSGVPGRSDNCHGANARHLIVKVPLGTIIKYEDEEVGSLDVEGTMYVAARGGAGGKGNKYFATDTDQSPKVAECGGQGEKFEYELELRTIADIGLIGFPNAGKSTLLRAVSRARPKVASYPFTTLQPYVGMIEYVDDLQLAVADIPGLIEKAHMNFGLGHDFLRHIQRCSALLFVIDASLEEPWHQVRILKHELDMYKSGLSSRPHAVIANKLDLDTAKKNFVKLVEEVEMPIVPISAKYGGNVRELISLIRWLSERTLH